MRRVTVAVVLLVAAYLAGYAATRQAWAEVWAQDGQRYVIYPEDHILYYLFRPMAVLDSSVSGIRHHIGPHR